VIFLAGVFATRKPLPKLKQFDPGLWMDKISWRWALRVLPLFVMAVAIYSIEKEPDLGTAAVIAVVMGIMFLVGGVSIRSLVVLGVLAGVGGSYMVQSQGYRMERVLNHEQRWAPENVDDLTYQTVQAELAMASGGWFGVGVGNGKAKHVLPATTTDFVMATVAEEFGLVGAVFVLGVLGAFVARLVFLAYRAPSQFGTLYLMGFASWICVQSTVNVAMANAAIPAIGIPLPFISSGGSSLFALWLAVGCAQMVLRPAAQKAVVEPVVSPAAPLDRELRWHMR
jgi:cell division protein FtsW